MAHLGLFHARQATALWAAAITMRSIKKCGQAAAISAVCAGLASAVSAQQVLMQSTFDVDAEGWALRTNNTACMLGPLVSLTPGWVATGGNPGGFIRHIDPSESRTAYWQAPAAFFGDFSAAYGGSLQFDMTQSATNSQYNEPDIVLVGGGLSLYFDTPYNPRTTWTHYEVPLSANVGWRVGRCDGPAATQAEIQQALLNVTAWYVRAEYRSGSDTDGLDTVMLVGPNPNGPPAEPTSTFDTDTEGWWIIADAVPSWDPTGGVPGGCLRGEDNATGDSYLFVAPPKFLGNRASLVGRTLEIDLKATPAQDGSPTRPFVSFSNGGIEIGFFSPQQIPGNVWRHHAVPLTPCPGWVRVPSNVPATQADFDAVFGAVSRFTVRGEYRDGDETEWVDNVRLGVCTPSAVANPTTTSSCHTVPVTFTVTPGGEAPFTYQWRRMGVPVSNGPGVSGAQSPSLTILGGQHSNVVYDCVVSNACGMITSNPARLSICVANFNCDAAVNSQDFFDFIAAMFKSALTSDINRDGTINSQDFFDFIAVFFAGC